MPVKKRTAKARRHRITVEAVTAFQAGDRIALHRALGLKPWHPSPLDVVEGNEYPAGTGGAEWRSLAVKLRDELTRV